MMSKRIRQKTRYDSSSTDTLSKMCFECDDKISVNCALFKHNSDDETER